MTEYNYGNQESAYDALVESGQFSPDEARQRLGIQPVKEVAGIALYGVGIDAPKSHAEAVATFGSPDDPKYRDLGGGVLLVR